MGDLADDVLDGFRDTETGEIIDGDAPGLPRTKEPQGDFASGGNPPRTPEQQEARRRRNRAKKARHRANKLKRLT